MDKTDVVEIVSVDVSEDIHITLYSDGTGMLEFMDEDEIVAAQLTKAEIDGLRRVLGGQRCVNSTAILHKCLLRACLCFTTLPLISQTLSRYRGDVVVLALLPYLSIAVLRHARYQPES